MSSDKTEQPTPKRIREAREKGDIAKSQDIGSAATVMALVLYFIVAGKTVVSELENMLLLAFAAAEKPFDQAFPMVWDGMAFAFLRIVGPAVILVMAVALFTSLAQVGVLFTFKAAMPKLDNISPGKWFQKVFSAKNAVELLKNLIKVSVLGITAWQVLRKYMRDLFLIPGESIYLLWDALASTVTDLALHTAGAFCTIAILDYLYQRWQYNKQHMMSKDEVRREYKEMDGDPYIKSKRKQLHQEMIQQNTISNVRRAKVLVTNPTHFAVALDYEKGKTPLPVVIAKGEGVLAQRMIQAAKEEGIPIMRNVPLARDLFANGTENAYIPQDLIQPVAEVLRWVQGLSTT